MRLTYDPAEQRWDLYWHDVLLRLRLWAGVLLTEYFGPASDAPTRAPAEDDLFHDALLRTRSDASVEIGPHAARVSWSLVGWKQAPETTLAITLEATDLPLQTVITLGVDEETGIVRRRTTLTHRGDGPELDIRHAGSIAAVLPAAVREVVHLTGRWGAETQVQWLRLAESQHHLESRTGKTGFAFAPYVALLAPTHTTFTELLWSGNWEYRVRRLPDGRVALSGGLNPWGLRHRLRPGDTLALPDALLGCVPGDLNAATQRLHRYRHGLRPNPARPVPVQFNSWFPCQGEPPVARMREFVARAADLGCEVFVLDAGWYTTETENPMEGWWLRTGDWVVNRRLFPQGLQELSAACQERGLRFGLWMEPEAVGPSSRIRRDHSEWLHAVGGHPTPPARRGILNLGVPAARAAIRERILTLLRTTGARWFKWDFNDDLHQGGWAPDLPEALTHQDPVLAHYTGLYQLADEIRAALPDLTLEMCSSGGGRFDAALLSHAHTSWISDQTHPLMKLAIHFGSQLAHPAVECNDWLVEWPPHEAQHDPHRAPGGDLGDLAFRLHVAMLGSFGISAPVEQWSAEDTLIVKRHVAWYKAVVRPVLQSGNQYLLTEAPPLDGQGDWAAIWTVQPDGQRGVLFAFRLASGEAARVFALPGLNPATNYRVSSPTGGNRARSGAALAHGLRVQMDAPFTSRLLCIESLAG